jgi:hypothetical protein
MNTRQSRDYTVNESQVEICESRSFTLAPWHMKLLGKILLGVLLLIVAAAIRPLNYVLPRFLPQFFADHKFEAGPDIRHRANFHIHKTQRQSDLADGVFR